MQKKPRKFPSEFFLRNTLYKILALVIALLLWFSLVRHRFVTETLYLPIRFSGLKENLVIASFEPSEVAAFIRAKGVEIMQMKKKELYYDVHLAGFEKGTYELEMDKRHIMGTENLSLFELTERYRAVQVVIDEKEEKYVPINIVSKGAPPRGYKLLEPIILMPSVVKVRGPKSVRTLETYPVDIEGKTESFQKEVTLNIPEHTTLLRNEDDKVFAQIEIVKLKTVEIQEIPLRIKGSYSLVYPKVVTLKMEVPVSMEGEALRRSVDVELDLQGYEKGNYNLVPSITHPEGVSLIDLHPSSIQVIIE